MHHVTFKDLAKAAKVSTSTLSRALNDKPDINPKTKNKILAVAKELGYTPNAVAKSLRLKKTGTLGVVIADISNPFFAAVIKGVEDTARRKGYNIILCNTDEKYETEKDAIQLLLTKRVDALLIAPAQIKDQDIVELKKRKIPFVLFGRHFEHLETDYVVSNNVQGAFLATDHLIKKGHKKILFINGPLHLSSAKERLLGYKQALLKKGIEFNYALLKQRAVRMEDGYRIMKKVLSSELEFTAVFTYSDFVALGVVRALREAGLRIPEDIAVVGYDDIDFISALEVPLTTVHVPKYRLGSKATQLVDKKIKGEVKKPQKLILDTQLIVRKSS